MWKQGYRDVKGYKLIHIFMATVISDCAPRGIFGEMGFFVDIFVFFERSSLCLYISIVLSLSLGDYTLFYDFSSLLSLWKGSTTRFGLLVYSFYDFSSRICECLSLLETILFFMTSYLLSRKGSR